MDSLTDFALFGNALKTQVLLIVALLEETHAGEIAEITERSRSRIKDVTDKFEQQGVLTGRPVGNIRRLSINDRFVAAVELKSLLLKIGLQDVELQRRLGERRRRPRRAGKPL